MPDYGNGKTNIDLKTGIRFGVISPHEVGEWWYENAKPYYGTPNEVNCPKCGHDCTEEKQEYGDTLECEECGRNFEIEWPECDPISFSLCRGGYEASQTAERDIFVTKSPYYAYGPFCSPCAPGAVSLVPVNKGKYDHRTGEIAFCFGHEAFLGGKAPYRVYDADTFKEVLPE